VIDRVSLLFSFCVSLSLKLCKSNCSFIRLLCLRTVVKAVTDRVIFGVVVKAKTDATFCAVVQQMTVYLLT